MGTPPPPPPPKKKHPHPTRFNQQVPTPRSETGSYYNPELSTWHRPDTSICDSVLHWDIVPMKVTVFLCFGFGRSPANWCSSIRYFPEKSRVSGLDSCLSKRKKTHLRLFGYLYQHIYFILQTSQDKICYVNYLTKTFLTTLFCVAPQGKFDAGEFAEIHSWDGALSLPHARIAQEWSLPFKIPH